MPRKTREKTLEDVDVAYGLVVVHSCKGDGRQSDGSDDSDPTGQRQIPFSGECQAILNLARVTRPVGVDEVVDADLDPEVTGSLPLVQKSDAINLDGRLEPNSVRFVGVDLEPTGSREVVQEPKAVEILPSAPDFNWHPARR